MAHFRGTREAVADAGVEGSGYVQHSYSVASYIGQTITIKFTGKETLGDGYDTNFFEDDNALNVS